MKSHTLMKLLAVMAGAALAGCVTPATETSSSSDSAAASENAGAAAPDGRFNVERYISFPRLKAELDKKYNDPPQKEMRWSVEQTGEFGGLGQYEVTVSRNLFEGGGFIYHTITLDAGDRTLEDGRVIREEVAGLADILMVDVSGLLGANWREAFKEKIDEEREELSEDEKEEIREAVQDLPAGSAELVYLEETGEYDWVFEVEEDGTEEERGNPQSDTEQEEESQ